jgi:transcriptional regulator with XRE-family HTH domain
MEGLAAEVARQVGRRIRRRPRYLDMTQEEVALRAGVHRTQMPLIENGHRMPRLHTLILVCTALDISPCQLLEGVGREVARPASEDQIEAVTGALVASPQGGDGKDA